MVSYDHKDEYMLARNAMVQHQLQSRDIRDPAVLDVMRTIPREQFVLGKYIRQAYEDCPLPIGMGQTISQPYIVALMTQHLELDNQCTVLEIGTGCGYQTAILASLSRFVHTIERLSELAEMAQSHLEKVNIHNVEFMVGDGSLGWPGEIPFDRIMITASVPAVPEPLTNQLAEGGKLIAPVGNEVSQELVLVHKESGLLKRETICGCRFVKLIGKYGFTE